MRQIASNELLLGYNNSVMIEREVELEYSGCSMYLKNISIENFKGIEKIDIRFQSGINLLIGDNGVGKSSILNAVIIALGGYFLGVKGIKAKGITIDDIRIVTKALTNNSNGIQYQFPVKIKADFDVLGESSTYTKSRHSIKERTFSILKGKTLLKYAEKITNDMDAMLPIFSYQSIHREKLESNAVKGVKDRRDGYYRCMDGVLNIKEITEWCLQMEIDAFKQGKKVSEYEAFKRLVGSFMKFMNDLDSIPVIEYSRRYEELAYTENGVTLPISKLSAGYQSLLFMMIDIAYRLAILNPAHKNLGEAEGIILIDEVDLHLHPKWQWNVITALKKTLPNAQFIIATHSPIVISSCESDNLIKIDEKQNIKYLESAYAYSIQDVLELRQDSHGIPKELQKLSQQFEEYVNDEDYGSAKRTLNEMISQFGANNSEVVKAKWMLNLEG